MSSTNKMATLRRDDGERTVLITSRETGDVIPEDRVRPKNKKVEALPFAKSWVHLMAGG